MIEFYRMKIYVPKRNENGTSDLSLGVQMKRALSKLGQSQLFSEENDSGPGKDFFIELRGKFTFEEVAHVLEKFSKSTSCLV